MDAATLRGWFERVTESEGPAREALLLDLRRADPAAAEQLERLLAQDVRHRASVTRLPFGSLDDDAPLPAPVERIGPWRLCEEIGRGGMGRVYRAVRDDGAVAQDVAIKLVRRDLLDERLLKRFSTERQLLASLEHPGLCRLIDTGELPDGTPFVVMELVRGESLLTWCRSRRLTLHQRLALFLGIADAVAHAHRNLVVHRDLKPGNVMVDRDGRARLLDFGIAKRLDGEREAQTLTTDRIFTLGYAAPEQIRGEPAGVACDVYGLGALLYELLCGVPPFALRGLAAGELERRILEHPPQRMAEQVTSGREGHATAHERGLRDATELRRALRGDLEHIVQRCLRKAPVERYTSVDLLMLDLRRHLDGLPISVRSNERAYRARRFLWRHRIAASVAAVALLLLLTALGYIAQQALDLRAQRDRATAALAFLREAFAAADPAQAAGADVRARDILDAATGRLAPLRAAQPALYAELASSIAEVQLDLGEHERAWALLQTTESAIADAGARFDARARDRVLLLRLRAAAEAYRLDEAERLLAQARAESALPAETLRLHQAIIAIQRGSLEQAIELLRALRGEASSRSPLDRVATEIWRRLGNTLRMAHRDQEALDEFDAMLAWQRTGLGPDHPLLLPTRVNRVVALRRLERHEEAVAEAQAVLADIIRTYGERGALAGSAFASLGVAQSAAGQRPESLHSYRRAVRAWSASLGPTHPQTLRMRFNVAMAEAGLVAGVDRDAVIGQLRSVVDDARHRDDVLPSLRHHFLINLAEQMLLADQAEQALAELVSPQALIGIESASDGNRLAHLDLADRAAARAGCRAGAPPDPASVCAHWPTLDRFRPASASEAVSASPTRNPTP